MQDMTKLKLIHSSSSNSNYEDKGYLKNNMVRETAISTTDDNVFNKNLKH